MLRVRYVFFAVLLFSFQPLKAQEEDQAGAQLTFLQQMFFENQDHQFDEFLLGQIQHFLKQNPFYKQNDQILWMYGNLLQNKKQTARALIQYLKIAVLYPSGTLAGEAQQRLEELVAQRSLLCLVDCQEDLQAYLEHTHFFENEVEGLFNIYNFIFSLNLSCFDEALLAELTLFEESCSAMPYSQDLLLYWKGQLQKRLGKFRLAYGHFRKLQSLFPQSSLAPAALFESALISYRALKRMEEARDGFIQLINHFPDDAHSALAQFYLADLYEKGLDSLDAAIDNYRLFLDAFPDHPLHAEAFKRLTLLLFRTERYEEAITLIGLNLNQHPEDSLVVSLIDSMANVLERKFKKYEFAARSYILLASQLPVNERTPYYLYRAARIYSKFLKDRARATDICNRLKKSFPENPYTEKCKLLLKQTIKK